MSEEFEKIFEQEPKERLKQSKIFRAVCNKILSNKNYKLVENNSKIFCNNKIQNYPKIEFSKENNKIMICGIEDYTYTHNSEYVIEMIKNRHLPLIKQVLKSWAKIEITTISSIIKDIKDYESEWVELYKVKLLFSSNLKDRFINGYNDATDKVKINKDGTKTVTFMTCGTYHICQDLFYLGSDVKILAPKKLKDYYIERLKSIISVYDNNNAFHSK